MHPLIWKTDQLERISRIQKDRSSRIQKSSPYPELSSILWENIFETKTLRPTGSPSIILTLITINHIDNLWSI